MPSAYVLMRCEEGAEKRMIRNLNVEVTIREVQPTIGHYDWIAKITSPSVEQMDEIIKEIHSNNEVLSTKILRMHE